MNENNEDDDLEEKQNSKRRVIPSKKKLENMETLRLFEELLEDGSFEQKKDPENKKLMLKIRYKKIKLKILKLLQKDLNINKNFKKLYIFSYNQFIRPI
jgi:hypothetical protein